MYLISKLLSKPVLKPWNKFTRIGILFIQKCDPSNSKILYFTQAKLVSEIYGNDTHLKQTVYPEDF